MSPEHEGLRLDAWLAEQDPELSRSAATRIIKDELVTVDGAPARPSHKLRAGQEVAWSLPEPAPSEVEPEDLQLRFLHEDEHLVFVYKPAGMPVHPDHHHRSGTLVNGLLHALAGQLSGVGGVERPGIVHRLDMGTSGVLVVAKDDRTHRGLTELFSEHRIERIYLALVRGRIPAGAATFDAPIERDPRDRKRMTGRTGRGKRALTHVEEAESFERPFTEVSLVRCRLETGRTHQIRVHLSEAGHSICGDPVYGPRRGLNWVRSRRLKALLSPLERPMLHAAVLGLEHPISGESIRVEEPPPEDFAGLLRELRQGG